MRIIAGTFASRKLNTLKGNATRPTLDKVKEAVFSSLGTYFDGGTMLDLYSGSGAVGLEALSRGMDQVILVDQSREAIEVIKENVTSLGVKDQVRVLPISDRKALTMLASEGVQLDLVYLDPPYAKQRNKEVMEFLIAHQLLKDDSVIVVESLKEDEPIEEVPPFTKTKDAVYGIMRIAYYRKKKEL